jgi:hypothetical protein
MVSVTHFEDHDQIVAKITDAVQALKNNEILV